MNLYLPFTALVVVAFAAILSVLNGGLTHPGTILWLVATFILLLVFLRQWRQARREARIPLRFGRQPK